jgi:hypothetical protein
MPRGIWSVGFVLSLELLHPIVSTTNGDGCYIAMKIVKDEFAGIPLFQSSTCQCDRFIGQLFPAFEMLETLNKLGDGHGRLEFMGIRIRVFGFAQLIDGVDTEFKGFLYTLSWQR